MEINSAGTDASLNTLRIRGRKESARPLPAVGFTNTTAGNKEEMGLESATGPVMLPNALCTCQSNRTHLARKRGSRILVLVFRRGRCGGRRNNGRDIVFSERVVERGKIFFHKLLEIRERPRKFGFNCLEQLQLRVGRGEVRASGNITASGADFGVKPNQGEVNLVGLNEIFIVTVDLRWR